MRGFVTRITPVVALAVLAALLQPAEPPPVFAAHTPAQAGKQWTAGTATLSPQYWTHTNYWTCAATICEQEVITPQVANAKPGDRAARGAGGVSSCPDRETTGGPGCGHSSGGGWRYNPGSHTDTADGGYRSASAAVIASSTCMDISATCTSSSPTAAFTPSSIMM